LYSLVEDLLKIKTSDHSKIQAWIKRYFYDCGYYSRTEKEVWRDRTGRIDVFAQKGSYSVGIEIDDCSIRMNSIEKLLPAGGQVKANDALELIKMFADTWLPLNAYDKSVLPKIGESKKQVSANADELAKAIGGLKGGTAQKREAESLLLCGF